jgi:MFS family permease
LWSGQVVSTLGTRISSVAYPLLVLALTHSPAKAGIVGFAQTLPYMLFFLPAGALVDRWNRKRVMLVADACRALALGSIAIGLAIGSLPFALIVAAAFVEGTGYVFFRLSESAALPQIVPKPQLPTAVARNQARDQGADLAGQPLGGALFGISQMLPFVFDAVSYAISFASLLFVRHAFLRATVILVAGSNFAWSAMILALIVRTKDLGASPAVIGLILGFIGGGAILGSLAAPSIQRRVAPSLVVIGSFTIWAVGALVLGFLTNPWAFGVVWATAGFFGPVFNVAISGYRYALVPDRLLARVQSAAGVIAWGAIPLGQLAAGLLLQRFGAVTAIFILAGVMFTVAAAAAATPSVRRAPRVEELLAST